MSNSNMHEFVTVEIADQLFGIPVLEVHDVLRNLKLTKIPLASPEVAGVLNLRGRIVTAIDVRKRLDMPELPEGQKSMSVVVEYRGEFYSLLIDKAGEVLSLNMEDLQQNPLTLDSRWRDVSAGVYRLEGQLLVILKIERLLDIAGTSDIAA
jgi:purine-binding chemotaxis protein CheW